MQIDRRLLRDVELLSQEAVFLGEARQVRARPTLLTQREKIQELERQAMQHAGQVVTAATDPEHKRAAEQARATIVSRGLVAVNPREDRLGLNQDGDLEQELHRRHAERIASWLERANQGTVARSHRTYTVHQANNFRASSSLLIESCGAHRGHLGTSQSSVIADFHGSLTGAPKPDTDTSPHLPASSSSPTTSTPPLDWRTLQYAAAIQSVSSLSDVEAQVKRFQQLAALGPLGQRTQDKAASAESLWTVVCRILRGAVAERAGGLSQRAAMVSEARKHLEDDFAEFLSREYGGGTMDTLTHVERYVASQKQGGDRWLSASPQWGAAFFCLRAGNTAAAVRALRAAGDYDSSVVVESAWPPVRTNESGEVCEVEATFAARSLADVKTDDPYAKAVRLILSRSATVQAVDQVKQALASSAACRFAQDHVWLHLALLSTNPPPKELDRPDAPYSLELYRLMVRQVPAADLSAALDPLLYCKVMLWSQCPAKAVAALLPPTHLEELAEFSLEGLHLALLLERYGVLTEDSHPTIDSQVQHQLRLYVGRLVKKHPSQALHYLRLLPEAAMRKVFHTVCLDEEACVSLLGDVGSDGKVSLRCCTKDIWPALECAKLARGAAELSREKGCLLLAAKQLLLVIYHLRSPDAGKGLSGLPAAAARDLVLLVNTQLTRCIEEMDDAQHEKVGAGRPTLPESAHKVLQAARLIFTHLDAVVEAAGHPSPPVVAFQQLYWMAVLSWNTSFAYDAGKAWQACNSIGLIPHGPSDVQQLVDEVNYRSDAVTVRKAIHIAVARVLDLIYTNLKSSSTVKDKNALLEMAQAVLRFQSQLRTPPSSTTASRLSHRRLLLAQYGIQ